VADRRLHEVGSGGRCEDVLLFQACHVVRVQQGGVAQVVADEQGRVQAGKVKDGLQVQRRERCGGRARSAP
jgi:hypothetical protein